MSVSFSLCAFVFLGLVDTVLSWVECGSYNYCSGIYAHCCSYDVTQCCYYYVYHFWWFWFIWVLIFTLIVSCSVCCYRRRRRYYHSDGCVVSQGYAQPGYGTVVTVGGPPSYQTAQTQHAATAPPPYPTDQKPPAYVP